MKTTKLNILVLKEQVNPSTGEAAQSDGPAELSRFEGEGGLAAPVRVSDALGAEPNTAELSAERDADCERAGSGARISHHQ
jgi:hypothetical protein